MDQLLAEPRNEENARKDSRANALATSKKAAREENMLKARLHVLGGERSNEAIEPGAKRKGLGLSLGNQCAQLSQGELR